MGRLVLYMSMSLDGVIAGSGDTRDNPFGTKGHRLHEWLGYWGGDHHDGVPIFVPTHQAPAGAPPGDVRLVTGGIESCAGQAKAAAGDRDVMLHGAGTARECLRARVLDVLEIQLVPVLSGRGRRLFDGLGPGHIELQLVRAVESPGALHPRYEVQCA